MSEFQSKLERLKHCNELIRTIASVGRKFLSDGTHVSFMTFGRNNRLYFCCVETAEVVYTHWKHRRWRGFHHGGTMQDLIAKLRDYISHGQQLTIVNPTYPTSFNSDGGDMWGYGLEATATVNGKAVELGIMKAREVE